MNRVYQIFGKRQRFACFSFVLNTLCSFTHTLLSSINSICQCYPFIAYQRACVVVFVFVSFCPFQKWSCVHRRKLFVEFSEFSISGYWVLRQSSANDSHSLGFAFEFGMWKTTEMLALNADLSMDGNGVKCKNKLNGWVSVLTIMINDPTN